jgi:hypothetical protein
MPIMTIQQENVSEYFPMEALDESYIWVSVMKYVRYASDLVEMIELAEDIKR